MDKELDEVKEDQKKEELIAKLVTRIDSLESMLKETADKGRMMRYESKHKDITRKKVRVNVYKGKIVDGWKMIKDDVTYIPQKGWVEDQVIQLHFIDGTVEEIKYIQFKDVIKSQVEGEIVKKTSVSDEYGEREVLTVEVNGQRIDLDVRFIN
jgi:hypothetical protein